MGSKSMISVLVSVVILVSALGAESLVSAFEIPAIGEGRCWDAAGMPCGTKSPTIPRVSPPRSTPKPTPRKSIKRRTPTRKKSTTAGPCNELPWDDRKACAQTVREQCREKYPKSGDKNYGQCLYTGITGKTGKKKSTVRRGSRETVKNQRTRTLRRRQKEPEERKVTERPSRKKLKNVRRSSRLRKRVKKDQVQDASKKQRRTRARLKNVLRRTRRRSNTEQPSPPPPPPVIPSTKKPFLAPGTPINYCKKPRWRNCRVDCHYLVNGNKMLYRNCQLDCATSEIKYWNEYQVCKAKYP